MVIGVIDLDEARRLVGAIYCPSEGCRCLTIPLPSGLCGFCDRKLTEPEPRDKTAKRPLRCRECDAEIVNDHGGLAVYCGKRCRNRAWLKTDKGVAHQREKVRKRNERKRERRAAARAQREAA